MSKSVPSLNQQQRGRTPQRVLPNVIQFEDDDDENEEQRGHVDGIDRSKPPSVKDIRARFNNSNFDSRKFTQSLRNTPQHSYMLRANQVNQQPTTIYREEIETLQRCKTEPRKSSYNNNNQRNKIHYPAPSITHDAHSSNKSVFTGLAPVYTHSSENSPREKSPPRVPPPKPPKPAKTPMQQLLNHENPFRTKSVSSDVFETPATTPNPALTPGPRIGSVATPLIVSPSPRRSVGSIPRYPSQTSSLAPTPSPCRTEATKFIEAFKTELHNADKQLKQSTSCNSEPLTEEELKRNSTIISTTDKNYSIQKPDKPGKRKVVKKIFLSQPDDPEAENREPVEVSLTPSSGGNYPVRPHTTARIRLTPPRGQHAGYDTSRVILEKYEKVRQEANNADTTESLDSAITNINNLLTEMIN